MIERSDAAVPHRRCPLLGVVDANIVFADQNTIPIGAAAPLNCTAPTETTTGIEGMHGGVRDRLEDVVTTALGVMNP